MPETVTGPRYVRSCAPLKSRKMIWPPGSPEPWASEADRPGGAFATCNVSVSCSSVGLEPIAGDWSEGCFWAAPPWAESWDAAVAGEASLAEAALGAFSTSVSSRPEPGAAGDLSAVSSDVDSPSKPAKSESDGLPQLDEPTAKSCSATSGCWEATATATAAELSEPAAASETGSAASRIRGSSVSNSN